MKMKSIGITTATIYGLKEKPYYSGDKCFWCWDIKFKDYPLFTFCNMFLYMGETEQKARETKRKIMAAFKKAKVSEGNRVPVIYHNSEVIAIGKPYCDFWIDIKDHYKVKKFKELKLNFDELFVACS